MTRRVLFVITTSDYGGTETYVRQLIERLDRSRFEPIFCSLCPLGAVGRQIEAADVETFDLGMAGGTKPLELIGAVRRLRREIDDRGIDLVLGLLYRANMLAALASRWAKRRPVFVSGQRSLNPAGGRLMVWGVQATRGLATHSIAVSPAVKDEMLRTERLDAETVTVLRNGVDTDRWRRTDPESARRDLGLTADSLVVAAAGRLTPVKGFHHLLDASRRLLDASPDVDLRLCLAGDGPEAQRLATQVASLGLGDSVKLLGRLTAEQLQRLYSAADVYALTSRAEGSPNAMLEAMACGCAVVATRVGGVLDIVEDGDSGLLIAPEDPGELATALGRLAADVQLRQRLAAGAKARIDDAFHLEKMVDDHQELFAGLL
ncbi:MAG: glycosyltransferase [Acidobacteriota bacterium]